MASSKKNAARRPVGCVNKLGPVLSAPDYLNLSTNSFPTRLSIISSGLPFCRSEAGRRGRRAAPDAPAAPPFDSGLHIRLLAGFPQSTKKTGFQPGIGDRVVSDLISAAPQQSHSSNKAEICVKWAKKAPIWARKSHLKVVNTKTRRQRRTTHFHLLLGIR